MRITTVGRGQFQENPDYKPRWKINLPGNKYEKVNVSSYPKIYGKSIYCETKPTAWLALRRWADLFEALNKSALYHGAILKTRL